MNDKEFSSHLVEKRHWHTKGTPSNDHQISQQKPCRPGEHGMIYWNTDDRNCQPRTLYSATLAFNYEGERRAFPDKQRLREFTITRPALHRMLKGGLLTETKRQMYRKLPVSWQTEAENCNSISEWGGGVKHLIIQQLLYIRKSIKNNQSHCKLMTNNIKRDNLWQQIHKRREGKGQTYIDK